MKNLLLGIVGILGIFGFCLGESFHFDDLGGEWNSSLNVSNFDMNFYVNSLYNYISLDEICFQSYIPYLNIGNGVAVVGLGDGNFYYSDSSYLYKGDSQYNTYCFTFSNPLIFQNNDLVYFGLHPSQISSFDFAGYNGKYIIRFPVRQSTTSPYNQSVVYSYMSGNYFNYGKLNTFFIGTNQKVNSSNNIYGLFSILFGLSFSEFNPSPKFKVNYGNTSYEYELSDNLEIHLKSPVSMSGSYNYIYDGPTGINLFYNNTSDFYNKDKLYLKSMYWYNKNIFTPICL